MNGSSLFDTPSEESRRRIEDLSRGLSTRESLAQRLRLEFEAPVGLLDARTSTWVARVGMAEEHFPAPDTCLTAALARGVLGHGRAFVWHPSRETGPCWLFVPITREGEDWLGVIGFAQLDDDSPANRSREPYGRACPERALRAWGQVIADELRGEAFNKRGAVIARTEGGERMLVSRLIRRMKMSDSPAQFQDLAIRAVKAGLGLEAAAWVPTAVDEPIVLAGSIDSMCDDDFRTLARYAGDAAVMIENAPKPGWNGIHRYAVIAADTKGSSGWIVAINPLDLRAIAATEVELIQPIASLIGNHRMNWRLYRDLKDMLFGIIRSLTEAIDAKDPYTKGHSQRVARIAVKLAEAIGLNAQQRGDIYLMGLLHDVGKIGIKDEVLKKVGPLEPDEYREIKRHVTIGVEILKGLTKLQHVLPAVRHHHEAYNGTGYPDQLAGDKIPFEARILAVADAFDAMASDRPYRKGLSTHRIQMIFREGSGVQWDPAVVSALFDCWESVEDITGIPGNRSLADAVGQIVNGHASRTML